MLGDIGTPEAVERERRSVTMLPTGALVYDREEALTIPEALAAALTPSCAGLTSHRITQVDGKPQEPTGTARPQARLVLRIVANQRSPLISSSQLAERPGEGGLTCRIGGAPGTGGPGAPRTGRDRRRSLAWRTVSVHECVDRAGRRRA